MGALRAVHHEFVEERIREPGAARRIEATAVSHRVPREGQRERPPDVGPKVRRLRVGGEDAVDAPLDRERARWRGMEKVQLKRSNKEEAVHGEPPRSPESIGDRE